MANKNHQNLEVYKETSSLGRLLVKPVEKALAKAMIVKNHYSHKWNDGGFGVYNFGIFRANEPDRCLGVGRVRLHEKFGGKDIYAPESESMDVRT